MTETEDTRFPLLFKAREGWTVAILLGLAFGVRLYLVFNTYLITHDGILYIKISKLISQGQVSEAFDFYFLNLYPLITAVFQRLFYDWEFSAQMVSTVFGSLTIIPFYLLTRSLFNRTVALISSILFGFHPYLVRLSAEVIRGPTFWFFLMMALWVGWEAICRKRAWLFCLTSLLGAVSFLLRPEGIFVIPMVAVWMLLKDWGTFKSTYRQRIVCELALLLTVPILLSPGMLYLKKKTGRWHWARSDAFVEMATADLTMSYVKDDFQKLELKPWDESPQGRVEFMRLRQFLSLATEHRMGIVVLEMISKFQKAMHPLLLVLLLFGTIRRKKVQYHKIGELFLLCALAVLSLILVRYGTFYPYIGTRHMMACVMLCLPWAGAGVVEAEHRISNTFLMAKSTGARLASFRYLGWPLLVLIVLTLLPKTLVSQRVEKIPIKEAGIWMKEHGPTNPVIMGQGQLVRIAFYADGTFLQVPRDQDLFEYAKKNQVNFLAVKEKNIEKTHPGLSPSLNPEHFKEEVAVGRPSGPYLIRIYSVKN